MKKWLVICMIVDIYSAHGATTLYQWRIWCNTENTYVTTWLEDGQNGPTVCPNNTNDVVNADSVSIVDVIDSNEISLKDEWVPTGGYFKTETFTLNVNAGRDVTTTAITSWPYDITLMEMQFNTDAEHENDMITVECPFDTIVGALVSNVSLGDTMLYVDVSSALNVAKGFYVTLDDGVNSEELGRVIAVDKVNNIITMEHAATNSYAAASPTYIKITVRPIDNFTFGNTAFYRVGASVVAGSPVPANRQVRIKYVNKGALAKKLVIPFEYLY
jgi:hypothetical protein